MVFIYLFFGISFISVIHFKLSVLVNQFETDSVIHLFIHFIDMYSYFGACDFIWLKIYYYLFCLFTLRYGIW